ncbi:ECF-type sigma factor [Pleionea sp. CnH1-48]|uniref:ECF-type sigma factor n=1 Tax=Pleionea sp. CnH1-48 TaxID=2954494 RepID=UPI002098316D|nr:ECF-type sigma factor [Pleionea sp. CnH1-48]MCO7223144.1 ECF-type sigma factor [Pleionea sp. CnH1-48]
MTFDSAVILTQALSEWRQGNVSTKNELDTTLINELHRLARDYMRRENAGHTLQATALVNEAFLRLAETDIDWHDKKHFMAVASKTMRRILVDHAKSKNSHKRRMNKESVTFDDEVIPYHQAMDELIMLDDMLVKLSTFDERASAMLELSLFGGLTHPEIADVTDVSIATVERDIRAARAWLKSQH